MPGSEPLELAVRANAAWCDVVCRIHRLAPTADLRLWYSTHRTPPLYPDAITLDPTVDEVEALTRIADGSGASIKDSFASLELTGQGYDVLLDATWIAHGPGEPPDAPEGFDVVKEKFPFAAWRRAWGGPDDVLLPGLRRAAGVTIIGRAGPTGYTDGAILHRTTIAGIEVVSLSNGFGALADVAAAAIARHPHAWIVGYEHGEDLDTHLDLGFAAVGPLRVWIRGVAS